MEQDQTSKVQPCDPKSWAEWFEKNTISEDFMVEYDQPTEQLRDDIEVQCDRSN
jgi:hypothetical protein